MATKPSRCSQPGRHQQPHGFALSTTSLLAAAIVLASAAATASAAPPPPPPAQAPPDQVISPVDVHAASLSDQPNIHAIGAIAGPDGKPHLFCIDPSEVNPASRLRQQMQHGADTLRYQ